MRITRKDAEGIFETLLKMTGGRMAKSYNDIGGYRLDYNPIYGGMAVDRISNEHGGVDRVIERISLREFWEAIRFYIRWTEETGKNPLER